MHVRAKLRPLISKEFSCLRRWKAGIGLFINFAMRLFWFTKVNSLFVVGIRTNLEFAEHLTYKKCSRAFGANGALARSSRCLVRSCFG